MYQKYFKRLLDISLSLILILLLFPVLIIIFFLIWYIIGFPIFKHKRVGLNNKIFTMYKFKTLYDVSKSISEKKKKK
jgi:lipopolysaccharide/colanic/teichoic acid biosynthesis glycosyltransferase